MSQTKFRNESDSIGIKKVPRDAYGGIFSTRAKENFSLSTRRMPAQLFRNVALLKHAAAEEHLRAKRLDGKVGKAILRACSEIMKGKTYPEFELDVYQAGAGTPINMALNEVVANRALELVGERKGKYSRIHPNIHVNMMQSTNDVIPTAMRLTTIDLSEKLEEELIETIHVAEHLSKTYSKALKTGRTHLQTAVPVTFGQELYAYAQSLRDALRTLREAKEKLYELSIGGTAVGTGITTEAGYDVKVVARIKKHTHQPYFPSHRKMLLTSHMTHFTHYSHALSELADELMVWANDWVILGSDPYAGIGEIKLPEAEPGSSIMPGKVNPSILEAMKMVCLQVQGNNETIRLASEATQLELNVMTPVMGSNLFESISLLTNALRMFRTKCLVRVKPTSRMQTLMSASVSTATSLNPYLGYDVVAHVVKRSMKEGIPVSELLVKEKILTKEEATHLMNPIHLTQPGKIDTKLKEKIRTRPSYSKMKSLVQRLAR